MQSSGYIKGLVSDFLYNKESKIAFSLYNGKTIKDITYKQFATDILKAATYFRKMNITNQNVAIIANASYEWFVAFFAISVSGNVVVPMNHHLPKETLKEQCEKVSVIYVFTDMDLHDESGCFDAFNCIYYSDLKDNELMDINEVHSSKPEDDFILMFTSGTTGKSKAVQVTDGSFHYAIINQAEYLKLLNRERVYLTVPVFHIAGIISAVVALHRNKTVCIGRGIKYMLSDMAFLNPTDVFFVPAMLETVVKVIKNVKSNEEIKKYLGNNLTNIGVGAASVNPDTCKYLMGLGFNVEVGYAMTELTGDGTRAILDENHINSIGKTFGLMECRIENGELLFKGPSVMKGYYNDPIETDKVLKDGWIYTGDLGYRDEEGYYYITGRKKNVMILPNGENVSPEELEDTISECSAVIECMVYNDKKGICMDVYTDDEETVKKAVKTYNQSVPLYRQIYKVNYFTEPLEKNSTGKIKRKGNAYV